eukprot:6214332-Pleurochrysis_carterae.AAC.4
MSSIKLSQAKFTYMNSGQCAQRWQDLHAACHACCHPPAAILLIEHRILSHFDDMVKTLMVK